MKHTISALVQNQPGVLAHVAGMFAARNFNIDSLAVGRTEDTNLSRMTIVVVGDDDTVEQVRKQLGKIIPVVKVYDFTRENLVQRDLMLIKITVPPEKRPEIQSIIEMFRAKVVLSWSVTSLKKGCASSLSPILLPPTIMCPSIRATPAIARMS